MQTADAEAEQRADERRDEIDLREGDAADAEVAQQRLGDEPEPLRPPGSVPTIASAATPQHDPAVVDAQPIDRAARARASTAVACAHARRSTAC